MSLTEVEELLLPPTMSTEGEGHDGRGEIISTHFIDMWRWMCFLKKRVLILFLLVTSCIFAPVPNRRSCTSQCCYTNIIKNTQMHLEAQKWRRSSLHHRIMVILLLNSFFSHLSPSVVRIIYCCGVSALLLAVREQLSISVGATVVWGFFS